MNFKAEYNLRPVIGIKSIEFDGFGDDFCDEQTKYEYGIISRCGIRAVLGGCGHGTDKREVQAFKLSLYSSFSVHSTFAGADLQRIFFNNDIIFGS